jgi:hypothetical protein
MIHVRYAAAAITSRRCQTVLITHDESGAPALGAHPQCRGADLLPIDEFRRTGRSMDETARSLINGLAREKRAERHGSQPEEPN